MVDKVEHYGLDIPNECKPYIRMVHSIAKRYHKETNPRIDYDDLVSVGLAAIMQARETWDENRNPRFSSYAYPHIKTAIEKEFQNTINVVSGCTPYHINNTEGAKEEIEFINANTVSLQASRKTLEGLGEAVPARGTGRHKPTLKEMMIESGANNPHACAERAEIAEKVDAIIAELEREAQDIVYRRVFCGDTFQDIAKAKKLTWRAVNYSFHKSMGKLKDKFEQAGLKIYAEKN
jgi:RNA polymerase sigma factor (sigma-70 family)